MADKMANDDKECSYEEIQKVADSILSKTPYRPVIGIICGSGLGALADRVEDPTVIPYSDIPSFPVSTVQGHAGKLVLGRLSGKEVVLMQGRIHTYEGYPVKKLAIPVRTMKLMGVKLLVVTNAAGGLNTSFKVGDIMLLKDHLNMAGFAGINPLVGKNDDRFGPRFPPMSDAYDRQLLSLAKTVSTELGFESFMQEGVYCFLFGPNFETVTESRFIRMAGGDAVGMSTVPEVVVARHAGMRVFGLTLITNMVVDDHESVETANHEEVLQVGKDRSKDLQALVAAMLDRMEL